MSSQAAKSRSGYWACPTCGWRVVDSNPWDVQAQLVADGWWWCADGHEKQAVVWIEETP
jgi:hypothetical protein